MKKKLLALLLVVALVASLAVAFTACNPKDDGSTSETTMPAYDIDAPDYSAVIAALKNDPDFKVGLICLHDENSTYDKNFIVAMEEAQKALGLSDNQVIIATGIDESVNCYNKACQLADAGCDIIFADSFGHESYLMQAAAKYPNVQFCHATGTQAHTSTLTNFGNAFASIYEGRYLAGIAAGMKLLSIYDADKDGVITDDQAKIGYVGAFTYAEVMSGYSAFYLGVKSLVPNVKMEVTFTGSWYDEAKEYNAAKNLINRGAKLVSQHADSMGAPNACEESGIPNVSYNGSTFGACEETFIISSRINWAPYYEYAIAQKVKGEAVAKDWTGSIKTGSVVLTDLGTAAATGTVAKLVEVREKLVKGEIKVFDTNNFTVGGEKMTSYFADVDTDAAFTPDTEAVENGIFTESSKRSAPYFNAEIDGIKLLDRNYGD